MSDHVKDDDAFECVNTLVRSWRQGDCVVGEHWFIHRFDPGTTLSDSEHEAAAEGGDLLETAVEGFVMLTQTCDIVRDCRDRPYVEVAPLVEVDERGVREIRRQQRPKYAYVAALADHRLVADLDRVMTVSKAVVAEWERTKGSPTEDDARRFVQALARKRARFAFPDDFTALAGKLRDRMRGKHDKQSPEGESLRALREIRVRAAPSWNNDEVELTFFFVRKDEEQPAQDLGHNWAELLPRWLALVPASGRFTDIHGLILTLDDLTARDYVESDLLDLDYLTHRGK